MTKTITPKTQMRQEILRLTSPVIAEQAFITLMGVINAIMAGHIGKEATAAIGMVDTLSNIFIAIFSAFAVGGTVVVAHYTGQNNIRSANETSRQALYAGVILASVITVVTGIFRHSLLSVLYGTAEIRVLSYAVSYLEITLLTYPLIALTSIACGVLRGAGDTQTPAKVVILMNIINIFFSYLLIFGFAFKMPFLELRFAGLGVLGAALGIGIARLTGALVLVYILIRGSLNLQINRIYRFQPDFELLKSILNIGVPASLESLLFNAGKLITQTFIVAMGTVSIVANYIAMSLHSLMVIPGGALGIAATALVGRYMGRRDCKEAKSSLFYMNKLATICLVILNLCSLPFFPFFSSLYTPNREIVKLSAFLLQITVVFIPFWPVAFILPAGFKGAGDVRYTLVVSAVSMWVFRITLGYILCIYFKLGVLGVWIGMYTDWIIRGTAFFIRLQGGTWQKHVVVKCLDDVV